ncbi:MAG: ABC transporter permease subunit [Elusimicrobiota bacterium]|nr:ABC transporter permease subunit [Elusimicrobiota bacterium]
MDISAQGNVIKKKRKWFDKPQVAEDSHYWKPKSEVWVWLAAAAYGLALLLNIIIPSQEVLDPHGYRVLLAAFIVLFVGVYLIALKRLQLRKKLYHKAQFIFALGLALAAWDLLTDKFEILPLPFFPSISEIIRVTIDDRALLLKSMLFSLRLFFVGSIVGAALGLVTGVLIGWWRQWDYWLAPIIRISGIIPAVAWLPIALVIFPTSFTTGVFLIVISSWFPVSSMMAGGIISTPKSYFEVAKTLGANEKFLLFRIAIPNAVPAMFTGITLAAAFSFTTLIVSEMVGAEAGLGFYINWAKGWGVYSKVYAAIIIIAIEFALILAVVGAIRNYFLRWQRGILK